MSHTRKNRNRRKELAQKRKSLKRRPFELVHVDGVTYAVPRGSKGYNPLQPSLLPEVGK